MYWEIIRMIYVGRLFCWNNITFCLSSWEHWYISNILAQLQKFLYSIKQVLHLQVHEQLFPPPYDYEIGGDLPSVTSAAQTNNLSWSVNLQHDTAAPHIAYETHEILQAFTWEVPGAHKWGSGNVSSWRDVNASAQFLPQWSFKFMRSWQISVMCWGLHFKIVILKWNEEATFNVFITSYLFLWHGEPHVICISMAVPVCSFLCTAVTSLQVEMCTQSHTIRMVFPHLKQITGDAATWSLDNSIKVCNTADKTYGCAG